MDYIQILLTGQKTKKETINPINKKDKCFQYAETVALNYEEIKEDPERISTIKSFINKYNWEGINYPSEKNDWKKFEKNNVTIALNVLIYPFHVSKHNSNREKSLKIFLMISKEDKHKTKS